MLKIFSSTEKELILLLYQKKFLEFDDKITKLLKKTAIDSKNFLKYKAIQLKKDLFLGKFSLIAKETPIIFEKSLKSNLFATTFFLAKILIEICILTDDTVLNTKLLQDLESIKISDKSPKNRILLLYKKSMWNYVKRIEYNMQSSQKQEIECLELALFDDLKFIDQDLYNSILNYLGFYKRELKYFYTSKQFISKNNFKLFEPIYNLWFGNYHLSLNNLEIGCNLLEKAITQCKDPDLPLLCYWPMKNLTLTYSETMGDYNKALGIAKEVVLFLKKFDVPGFLSPAIERLGVIYYYKGELNLALTSFEDALQLVQKNKPQDFNRSRLLYWMGALSLERGNFGNAEEYLVEALNVTKKIEYNRFRIQCYYQLIQLAIKNNNRKKTQNYQSKFKSLHQDLLNRIQSEKLTKFLKQIDLVVDASILHRSSRLSDKMKALEIYRNLADNSVLPELLGKVFFPLCDLLFLEYKQSKNSEILVDIKKYLLKLIQRAEIENSYIILVETLWLKAKLFLLTGQILEALENFTYAQRIAEDKGLKRLAIGISKDYDEILPDIENQEKIIQTSEEKIDLFLNKIDTPSKFHDITINTHDKSIGLVIISKSGTPIHSISYSETVSFDELMISAFLTANNQFANSIFQDNTIRSGIDRIMFRDYILALRSYKNLVFCYIFQGDSYSALNKIDRLFRTLNNNSKLVEHLKYCQKYGMVLNDKERDDFNRISDAIFR